MIAIQVTHPVTRNSETYHLSICFQNDAVMQHFKYFKPTCLEEPRSMRKLGFRLATKAKANPPTQENYITPKTKPNLMHFNFIFHSGLGLTMAFLLEVLLIYLNFTENLLSLFIHSEITVPKKVHVFSLGQFLFYFSFCYSI